MKVGLVAQRDNERAVEIADAIRAALDDDGVDCRLDTATATSLDLPTAGTTVERLEACDLVVSVGGDGTFLFATRAAGDTPMIGVNLGEVGFLNAVAPENAVDAVRDTVAAIRRGDHAVREAPRLTATCTGFESVPAVNEIVVSGPRRGHGGGASFEIEIDGSTYSTGHADGVMVATQTGSTAYNLSEGGPLVHPAVDALVVTEMCGVEERPPLVVDDDAAVTIAVRDAPHAVVVSDGRQPQELELPVAVTVSQADTPVRLAGPTADFFDALGKLS
ncbi:NAD(+)/NADH kinase [Halonotius terrestris]|uniref:NAD kinase n=1 Tax=Halonotius terrestris TaxID=2487750 RepID=A0A8J8PBS0_9EURY|nr:NAD(+)/NADH kinase [Halonotius terrestris]TQQ81107.1 NAD(+)/NADH kinase [Halonotius terrestris]